MIGAWYNQIVELTAALPAWALLAVWVVFYGLIIASLIGVIYRLAKQRLASGVAWPVVLNLIFNLLFVPLQLYGFGLTLGVVDAVLVLLTFLWALKASHREGRWFALVNLPYILWIVLVTVIQITILRFNW